MKREESLDRKENLVEINYAELCRKRVVDNISIVGNLFRYLKKKGWKIKLIELDFKDWDSYERFLKEIKGVGGFLKVLRDYIEYHYGKIGMEYFAYAEFQQRGMVHWHIYIITDRYVHFERLGGKDFFSRKFDYGYIYIKNLMNVNIGYMIKKSQKSLEAISYFKEWCWNKGIKKVKMFIRSIGLKKNFKKKFDLLKIKSRLLRNTLGRIARKWEKIGSEYVFYLKYGIKIIVNAYWKYYYGRLLFMGAKVSLQSPLNKTSSVLRFMNFSQYEKFILYLYNKFKN